MSIAENAAPRPKGIIFGALSREDLHALRERATPIHYPANRQIFAMGESDQTMLLVETGRVQISVTSAEGRRSIIAQLGPGDVVGEMAALDGGPRSAFATAAGHVTGRLLTRPALLDFLKTRPEVAISIIETLCQRLRSTNDQLAGLALKNGPTRLARVLAQLFDTWGTQAEDGVLLAGSFTQTELGDMAGLTRETVNRLIRSWDDAGILRREKDKLVLLDADALDDIATAEAE
ncbi:Crp/Fnr family transcriptional regulator [Tropicibacter naphthalenivorans]|uniref:cAMP regulatory protein n=1 Tax=Tropicibacter naphthalenivorans TaxID=441103 RepID=A0A0P1G119_9RHOB|nr:Crp/Fnr family transcriptional regulator [Tropicibacter naphthalenivorans]CUH75202.1 cAMP regulatory protein [Tropicibacter naphthalenivorans]SMC45635.1 Crp-like helix-turn-helix domain-containing protein [Tropicibacter naphthalenivorans]